MSRVDAHHHVWDLDVRDEPWITGEEMQPIRRNFSLDDLRPDAEAAGVNTTVLVQTVASVDETRDFLRLAEEDPLVGAVTGWVDLTSPGVADELAGIRDAPGGSYLRAIRHGVQAEPDAEWLARDDVRRGLAVLADAGLTYELLTYPIHLDVSIATVRALPGLSFVLDHCSKPRIADDEFEPWASGIRELATLPNVTCKLSGLVTEADWSGWTPASLRPYADVVLEEFGPERVMFGSDWPVCLLASSYADWVAAAEELTSGLSDDERTAVFGTTARRVYGLDPA